MQVYRITLSRWAGQLTASGQAARWNSRGRYVIYTAASRALACLENVVHRSGEGLSEAFRVMILDVPDDLPFEALSPTLLPENWTDFRQYPNCQALGDSWLVAGTAAVLRVPSALIPQEFNYLLNPAHADFQRIRLVATEPFWFDSRLKKEEK